ncbi:hypothetical protein GQ457_15G027510 [Hibiscus cannabinus]
MASVNLSPDLICEILRRSSVNDLLRFRCVSKAWRSLIDDSGFIKLHLSHSLETSTNLSLLLSLCGKGNIYSVNFASLKNSPETQIPWRRRKRIVVCLVLAMVLLALSELKDVPLALFKRWLLSLLPVTEIGFTPGVFSVPHVFYGFGYDPTSDDYKLVRLSPSNTNHWRRKEDFPFYVKYTRLYAVLVNNALHWEVSTTPEFDSEKLRCRFDSLLLLISVPRNRVIELPDCLGERLTTNINAMGGCLV